MRGMPITLLKSAARATSTTRWLAAAGLLIADCWFIPYDCSAFIVTDKPLLELGLVDGVRSVLDDIKIHHQIFYHVAQDPDTACIAAGTREIQEYQPDVIIALGGGSPMDAAKLMWLQVNWRVMLLLLLIMMLLLMMMMRLRPGGVFYVCAPAPACWPH